MVAGERLPPKIWHSVDVNNEGIQNHGTMGKFRIPGIPYSQTHPDVSYLFLFVILFEVYVS